MVDDTIETRITVLEHKVRLISVVLKWLVAGLITALAAIVLGVKM
jgi:hypothetical protein